MVWLKQRAAFCANVCPICKRARTKGGIALWFVKNVDRKVCPFCKAYEKVHQKPAYE